jgi:hypothetical protein
MFRDDFQQDNLLSYLQSCFRVIFMLASTLTSTAASRSTSMTPLAPSLVEL